MSTSEPQLEPMMNAQPQKEHQWLQRLVGDWTVDSTASMGPDAPPMNCSGDESVRTLGDLWVLCEGHAEMPGQGPATTIMTLGFDPDKKRFVGTFIGSMMTYLWIYDGELDQAGRVLTLSAEGPDFSVPGKMAKYRDVIEIKDDDHRVLSSHFLNEDGTWQQFMSANLQRKK